MSIALMLNGPSQWYSNLLSKYNEHKKTWLQQNQFLDPNYEIMFRQLIQLQVNGYFTAYGYVQNSAQGVPDGGVKYCLHIGEIKKLIPSPTVPDDKRILPPDATAPDFATYDISQGKCRDVNDYRYRLWLRVDRIEIIKTKKASDFIVDRTGKPFRPAHSAHYYVRIPD